MGKPIASGDPDTVGGLEPGQWFEADGGLYVAGPVADGKTRWCLHLARGRTTPERVRVGDAARPVTISLTAEKE